MKNLVTGLFFIGLASLGIAQESEDGISTFELEDVTVSAANLNYLRNVQDETTPEVVQELQYKAANFDIKAIPGYDKNAKLPLEVIFEATNGKIIAAYDREGSILYTNENFENVTLPMVVRKMVFEGKDGWRMDKNQYICTYSDQEVVKKRYKIALTDGTSKEKVVINLKE